MGNQTMPDHRLKCLRVWGDPGLVYGWHNHHRIADLLGISTVAPHYSHYLQSTGLGLFEGVHNVGTDIPLHVTTTDGKYEHRIVLVGSAGTQPGGKNRIPTFVVGAGG